MVERSAIAYKRWEGGGGSEDVVDGEGAGGAVPGGVVDDGAGGVYFVPEGGFGVGDYFDDAG